MKKIVLAMTAVLILVPLTAHAVSTGLGLNLLYWGDPATGGNATSECGNETDNYCDTVLLEYSNPLTQADIAAGNTKRTKSTTIMVNNFGPVPDPVTDFDLIIFESDAQGTRGTSSLGRPTSARARAATRSSRRRS